MKQHMLLAAAAATVCGIAPAHGQSTNPDSPVAASVNAVAGGVTAQDPASGLQEIVVTAQRRSENLQKVAVPIDAVSGEALARSGVVDAQTLTSLVPAIQIAPASGPYNIFYLRGIGSFNVNPFSDSPIAFNVDGIAITRPSSTSGLFYDISRVEVLKGPQGTLYGRNATGGAINVITNAPQLDDLHAGLSAQYGNYNAFRAEGYVNVPVGQDAAIRGALLTSDRSGYLSDGTSDDRSRAGRIRGLSKPTPDLTLQLGADFYHQGGRGGGGVTVADDFIKNQIGNSDPVAQAYYQQLTYFPGGSTLIPLPNDQHQNNNFWGVNADIEWRTPFGTLTVLPAFRHNQLDYQSSVVATYVFEESHSQQASVEARFASDDSKPLRWIVGGYYLDENAYSALDYNTTGFALSRSRASLPVTSAAGFGQLTYALTDRLRITGGVRHTVDRKTLDATGVIAVVLCPGALGTGNGAACAGATGIPYSTQLAPEIAQSLQIGAPVPIGTHGNIVTTNPIAIDREQTFSKTTFRAAAEWDAGPRSLLYASVETGFKAGGFYIGNIDPVYRPETITAYTIGSKNRFLDNKLQLNVELFYWRYKDQQVSFFTEDSLGAGVFATQNVGKSTSKGVEASLDFAVTKRTLLGADIQYLDAKYDSFVYNVANEGAPPTPNCPYQPDGAFFTVDCSGKPAANSPKVTLSLTAQQSIPVGSGEIVISGQTKFQTRSFVALEFLPSEVQNAVWVSNAEVSYNAAGGHWSVGTFINNIEDARVLSSALPQALLGAALVNVTLRPPRTYGIRASVNF